MTEDGAPEPAARASAQAAIEAAIEALIEDVNRAWLAGRYEAIAPHVHPDVVLAPPGGGVPIVGREAFVRSYAEFGAMATVHAFEQGERRIDVWGDTAVATCPFRIDYELPSGRFREQGTDVLVLVRNGADWLICWRTITGVASSGGG